MSAKKPVRPKRKRIKFRAIQPLMYLLRQKKNIVMAELGVFKCESTLLVLNNISIKKYYAIDSWKSYHGDMEYSDDRWAKEIKFMEDNYQSSVRKLSKFPYVKIIRKSSVEATKYIKDGELDFCYIDADHHYKYVLEDIKNWIPKVKKGGILAGDDYFHPPVAKAVTDFFKGTKYKVHTEGSHKGKPRSWWIEK